MVSGPRSFGLCLGPVPCNTLCWAAPCVCAPLCLCLSEDRSDSSFICFELSVDYLAAVWSYHVLAGTDWRVGVALGRWKEMERSRGRKEAPRYPIRNELPLRCLYIYAYPHMHTFVHTRTHLYTHSANRCALKEKGGSSIA